MRNMPSIMYSYCSRRNHNRHVLSFLNRNHHHYRINTTTSSTTKRTLLSNNSNQNIIIPEIRNKTLLSSKFHSIIQNQNNEKLWSNIWMTRTTVAASVLVIVTTAAITSTTNINNTSITSCHNEDNSDNQASQQQQHRNQIRVKSLSMPTVEALVRAMRLIRTVTIMSIDYYFYDHYNIDLGDWFNMNPKDNTNNSILNKNKIQNNDNNSNQDDKDAVKIIKEEEVETTKAATTVTQQKLDSQKDVETELLTNSQQQKQQQKDDENIENVEKIIEQLEVQLEQLQEEFDNVQIQYSSSKQTVNKDDNYKIINDESQSQPQQFTSDVKRQQKQNMQKIASEMSNIENNLEEYYLIRSTNNTNNNKKYNYSKNLKKRRNILHERNAYRLLQLCHDNQGVYIKLGQHLANYDYILPKEYIDILSSSLYHLNPPPMLSNDIDCIFQEEFGINKKPNDIFEQFDYQPIASASLAQVHIGYLKIPIDKQNESPQKKQQEKQQQQMSQSTQMLQKPSQDEVQEQKEQYYLQKVAIKIQHRGLRETSVGDINQLVFALNITERLFPDFKFGWILDEVKPNLPKELNFINEGNNSELASYHLQQQSYHLPDNVWIIPKVIWNYTSERILTMHFEEGCPITDLKTIKDQYNLNLYDIASLLSSIFASQVYLSGFVHCDPHPANVLVRSRISNSSTDNNKKKKSYPQLVLLDHGLYRELDDNFRLSYASLWKHIWLADIKGIKNDCNKLGLDDNVFSLFTAIVTGRPFDEIMERSSSSSKNAMTRKMTKSMKKTKSSNQTEGKASNQANIDEIIIRGYAQKFLPQIIALLEYIPRPMILILKCNECIRHIQYHLLYNGITSSSILSSKLSISINGKYAAYAIYQNQLNELNNNHIKQQEHQNSSSTTINTSLVSLYQNMIHKWFYPIIQFQWNHFKIWWDYHHVILRISLYEMTSSLWLIKN